VLRSLLNAKRFARPLSRFVNLSLALSLTLAVSVAVSFAEDRWSDPYLGVSYLHRTGPNQLSAHGVVVDLCAAGVGVRHTAFSERGRTASSFAQLTGAQVVINGDWSCRPIDVGSNSPFPPCRGLPSYHTYGVAAHAGQAWPSSWSRDGLLAFAGGRVEMYDYNDHKDFAPWMQEAMSGHFQLVRDGSVAFEAATGVASDRPPRSAIGLSRDRTELILVAVDGRRSYIGMNEAEIAAFLVELGAWSAFGLDGGGSSTLWIQSQGVVNDPSDGGERVVGPHLGIFASGQGTPQFCDRPWEEHPNRPLPALQAQGARGGFFPRTPIRVYDTRNPTGSAQLTGLQRDAQQRAAADRSFGFSSFGSRGVPANASAVAMNLTLAGQNSWGFVTAWPGHLTRPDTSNLNHGAAGSIANSALVHLGPSQEMKLYSYAAAHHLGDLTGWFAPGGAGFVPTTPRRLLDSRSGPPIASESSRQIIAAPQNGESALAIGVVALSSSPGFFTIYPCDQPRPDTSVINFGANDIVSGSMIVPTGPGGVCAYSYGESHILVDLYGTFKANQGAEFQAVTPIRVIDTRSTSGRWVGRVPHQTTARINLRDMPNFPSNATAVSLNLTAVSPAADGFASIGPCSGIGGASAINYKDSVTKANHVIVGLGDGNLCLTTYGRTHILMDILGVFVPPRDLCDDQPCLNGASCVSGWRSYSCQCSEGFSGQNCGQDIDDCQGSPCQNGGSCIDGVASYTCECPLGFGGAHCQEDLNDCADQPCQNGGSCLDEVNSYRCECPEGFSGNHCELNIDDCEGVLCEHGGRCLDLINDFECECPPGYSGEYCEEAPPNMEPDMWTPMAGAEPYGGEEPPLEVDMWLNPEEPERGGESLDPPPPAPEAGEQPYYPPLAGYEPSPQPMAGVEGYPIPPSAGSAPVSSGCEQGPRRGPASALGFLLMGAALMMRRRAQGRAR